MVPSILWANSGPLALNLLCWGGALAALLLLFNIWPRMSLFLCWLFYLSYVSTARSFSGFQSDGLMLESAILAIFLAPRGLRPGLGTHSPPSKMALFMMRWLLFRLVFISGMVKLLSGDVSWRTFAAMNDYYVNCPFPTWIGWYVQHLPHPFHAATVLFTFFVELFCGALVLFRRRDRIFAFFPILLQQIGILLTANYTFLNYSTIALAFLLLDDRALQNFSPRLRMPPTLEEKPAVPRWRTLGAGALFTCLLYITGIWVFGTLVFPPENLPRWMLAPVEWTYAFRSANSYGLFAVMTHERKQIEFEGSDDGGLTWKAYEFKWQPQKLDVPPRFMAPHLPRFDWNLWFAVLGRWAEYPFVLQAGTRLMEGEPTVIALFARNPFPSKPPLMVRFPLYRYKFTDLKTLRATGNYWTRERVDFYAPTIFKDPSDGKIRFLPTEGRPSS